MNAKNFIQKILQYEYSFVIFLICINLLVGVFIVSDYGVSPDEPLSWHFGTSEFLIYFGKGEIVNVDYSHGGGFLIPAKLGQMIFSFLFPSWIEPFTWHITYFLFFQISIFLVFILAKKFVGLWAANFSSLLYATQPLLWGHAFINPKDIPFLVLFMSAIVLGIQFSDDAQNFDRDKLNLPDLNNKFSADKNHHLFKIKILAVLTAAGGYALMLFGGELVKNLFENLIPFGFDQTVGPIDKILFSALILGGGIWLFPRTTRKILTLFFKITTTKWFIAAAAAAGMCTSARTMGIIVFGIIGVYWFYKNGWRAALPFIFYLLTAAIVSFILWPHLWETPLPTFIQYLQNMVGFENWDRGILFEGEIYRKFNYPNYFVPKLISLQLTEPVLIFSLLGMIVAGIKVWRKKYDWMLTALLAGWFLGPAILAVVLHPVIYNNFRHLLFILPPLFIFSGIFAETLFTKIQKPLWRILLIAAIIFPGIFSIIHLHPYEYIYYNSLAGGLKGAYRVYELDYWGISNKEAVEYLNSITSPNVRVVISYTAAPFAREDFHIINSSSLTQLDQYDYVVMSTNINRDWAFEAEYPDSIEIQSIEIHDIPLLKIYTFPSNN